MANKVFLLEDDKSICELVKCTLDLSSISCEYFTTVKEFREAMERETAKANMADTAEEVYRLFACARRLSRQ